MKKKIKVVAAIIENERDEIFCALRSTRMSLPNLWEFPGGKVEAGEDIYTALIREIKEELSCDIGVSKEIYTVSTHVYDTFIIELVAIKATLKTPINVLTEHAQFVWLKRENLKSLVWAPADVPVVEKLVKEIGMTSF